MQNIARVVENINEISKTVGYEPAEGTNWSDLSDPIRMMCIEAMNFETRIRLRKTSKAEKSMIDSSKYEFDRFSINEDGLGVEILLENFNFEKSTTKYSKNPEQSLNLIEYVMKTCNIGKFDFSISDECAEEIESRLLEQCTPFGLKRIAIEDPDIACIFLKNCPNLERFVFDNSMTSEFVKTFFKLPSFAEIREFVIPYCLETDVPCQIARKWIKTKAEIRQTVEFVTKQKDTVEKFLTVFKDRIIHHTDGYIKIRMNNKTRQVLLQKVGTNRRVYEEYYSLKVIPIDLPQSEYGNGDDWINWRSVHSGPDVNAIDEFRVDQKTEKIKKVVANVAAKSEEVGYDAKKDTNWCHLPVDLRTKCVNRMDFETRTHLRATSKTEQFLVESKKYHFDRIILESDHRGNFFRAQNGSKRLDEWDLDENITLDFVEYRENTALLADAVWKLCEVEEFVCVGIPSEEDEDEENPIWPLEELVKFQFRSLSIHSHPGSEAVEFLLEGCTAQQMGTIVLNGSIDAENIDFPSVFNARELRIDSLEEVDAVWDLIRKWIETDAEVGRVLQFKAKAEQCVEQFEEEFSDRVVHHTNEAVLIRMDNKSKQIVMKLIAANDLDEYIVCKVVPKGFPESEYAKGTEWLVDDYQSSLEADDED